MVRRVAVAAGLVLALAAVGAAQTADEIVAKSIAAHGGADKLKAVRTMRMTGTMSMMGMDMPLVVEQKRPDMVRVDITINGTANTQAYDGTNGWLYMPVQGMTSPQPAPPDVLKDLKEQADFDLPFMDYQGKGNKIELAGKEPVGTADTYKLKVTLKNGDVRNYYVDAKSYLPMKVTATRMIEGQEANVETVIGDYKDVNGVMMPYSIENRMPNVTQKMVIEKIETNVPIDDARFKMPSAK